MVSTTLIWTKTWTRAFGSVGMVEQDGKANDAVLRLLAKALDRPVSTLELVRGATGRNKLIRLTP